jgi:hypothetical protein
LKRLVILKRKQSLFSTNFVGIDTTATLKLENRVTGLAQFSPFGRLFSLGRFLKCLSCSKFWDSFLHRRSYELILTKKGWAKVWALFSQTHLVTLLETEMMTEIDFYC